MSDYNEVNASLIMERRNSRDSHTSDGDQFERLKRSYKKNKFKEKTDTGLLPNMTAADFIRWIESSPNYKALLLVMDYHSVAVVINVDNQFTFACSACENIMNTLKDVNQHIQDERHLNKLNVNNLKPLRMHFTPNAAVFDVLNDFFEDTITNCGCSTKVLQSKLEAFEEITNNIFIDWPEANLALVGSSYHGMGLSASDLNIALLNEVDEGCSLYSLIEKLADHFSKYPEVYCDTNRFFYESKKPCCFTFKWNGILQCSVLLMEQSSYSLARLLKAYSHIDSRVKKLCILFRKWADVCGIDGKVDGYWPSHATYLLVIYFLQQIDNPVLPVLHEFLPTSEGPNETYDSKLLRDSISKNWKCNNTSSLSFLWLKMLEFYGFDFYSEKYGVSIKQKEKLFGPKKENSRLYIQDPYVTDRDINRTVHHSTCDYITHCIRRAFTYFSIPQCIEGAIFGSIKPEPTQYPGISGYSEFLEKQVALSKYIVSLIPILDSNYKCDNSLNLSSVIQKISELKDLYVNICCLNLEDFYDVDSRSPPSRRKYEQYSLFLHDAQYLMNQIDPTKLRYRFHHKDLTYGRNYPRGCTFCNKFNHSINKCPKIKLGQLPEVIIDKALINSIDLVCSSVFKESVPSTDDVTKKNSVLTYLQSYISQLFPDALLTLYGSSVNGFGVKNSDMDICMTFKNCNSYTNDMSSSLNELYIHMVRCLDLDKIVHIGVAKVPIVKFLHTPSMLEGDISLYNILAQENTRMLKTYADIDKRVKVLGYMVKKFAKVCHICDASRGSLSSYCYILMMIYFLQRCSPPVIPVLQCLPEIDEPLPERFIEECNVYFFEDISQLGAVWSGYKANLKTAGELWIEFLRFYTEIFDIDNYVISIRKSGVMLKQEKQWYSKAFAIEDPFLLTRNLGSGLSRSMHMFIIKSFRNARNVFTKKIELTGNQSVVDTYFDERVLSIGNPPNDGRCHTCGCIGHRMKDCPEEDRRRGNRRIKDISGGLIKKETKHNSSESRLRNATSSYVTKPYKPKTNTNSASQAESYEKIMTLLAKKNKAPGKKNRYK